MPVDTVIQPANIGSVEHVPASKGFRLQGENTNPAGNNKVYGQDGTGAKGYFGGALIKSMLELLSGTNRLDFSAIKNAKVKTELTAGGTDIEVWHTGAAPTFTSSADGVFELNCPATCVPSGFNWSGNNADLNEDGDAELTIISTDGHDLHFTVQIKNKGNNQIENLVAAGIQIAQDDSTPGTNVATITTLGFFGSAGFLLMGRFAS